MALSYCWGKNPDAVMTTSETIAAHKQAIRMDTLPKTIQDAVTITRKLGIPYLWVDALCIIQGDLEDWTREAGKMCQVYSNAELTISASSATASSQGIFGPQRFGLPPRILSHCGRTVNVCQNIAREHNRLALQMRGVEPLPINHRAWTLQESILSNRVIHYTPDELVWECNEWYLCECGYANVRIQPDDDISNRIIRQPDSAQGLNLKATYHKWRDTVMAFTERQLSIDDDRLTALSGVTRQFRRLIRNASGGIRDQYLTGLWSGDLARGLLWTVEDDWLRQSRDSEVVYRRPRSWRAPSWSWAAVEGPVNYDPLARLHSLIDLVEAEILPKTVHDDTGQVASAKLIVAGQIVNGVSVVAEKAKREGYHRDYVRGTRYQICHHGTMYDFLPDDPVGPSLSATYSCFLVGQIDWWGPKQCFFIVLQRSSTTPGAYKRVGVSCLSHGTTDGQAREHFPIFDNAARETICVV